MNLRTKFRSLIGQTSPYALELEIAEASGSWLRDPKGKKYLDLISGIGVSNLGHGNRVILEAIHAQTDQYLHTMVYGEHIQSPQVLLAELLVSQLPPSLNTVFYLNSGAEAVEGALKLARKFTGRTELLACKQAYHGSTYGAMSLMSDRSKTDPYRPLLPGIDHVEFNRLEDLEKINRGTAAVVMEVIQAEAGIRLPDPAYLEAIRNRCTETGSLLIFDEIQTGMGRTGTLFAFSHYGVVPDVLILGKSFGGGLPLSAFVADTPLMGTLADKPPLTHMTTFGGHPLSCAAGLAALKLLTQSSLVQDSMAKSDYLAKKLDPEQYHALRRTPGLWLAIDLADPVRVQKVIAQAMDKGLLADWFLFNDESIRIAPPLTISFEELDLAAAILNDSLTSQKSKQPALS